MINQDQLQLELDRFSTGTGIGALLGLSRRAVSSSFHRRKSSESMYDYVRSRSSTQKMHAAKMKMLEEVVEEVPKHCTEFNSSSGQCVYNSTICFMFSAQILGSFTTTYWSAARSTIQAFARLSGNTRARVADADAVNEV